MEIILVFHFFIQKVRNFLILKFIYIFQIL